MKTLEELAFELDRVGAAQQCEQLMSTYVSLHMEMRHKDYMKLWTHRSDCKLEMPWGAYEGFKGVERCYLKDHGDRSMPEIQELLKGLLCVHCIGTSVIEVARDGKTARGVWISPGFETANEGPEGPQAMWAWSKYGVDFLLEDDGWKIWKMKVYPLFQAPYDTCWTDVPPYDGFMLDTSCDHPLERPIWNYDPKGRYPDDQPAPPEPYGTYDDVGYTW